MLQTGRVELFTVKPSSQMTITVTESPEYVSVPWGIERVSHFVALKVGGFSVDGRRQEGTLIQTLPLSTEHVG